MTGTAAAQTEGHQLRAQGSVHVEIITNPQALLAPLSVSLSQRVAILVSQVTLPHPFTPGLVTEKNSLSRNFMTPSIMAVCCVSSPGRVCLVAAVCT